MAEENIKSQKFRMKNIEKARTKFINKKEQNELISNKHKKGCLTINYIEHFFVLASAVTGCISISVFASLLGISIGIMSSAIG